MVIQEGRRAERARVGSITSPPGSTRDEKRSIASQFRSRWSHEGGLGLLAVIGLGLYGLVMVIPLLMSVRTSFTDSSPLQTQNNFVGLANFRQMFHDTELLDSLRFTLGLALGVTIAASVLGITLATLLNRSTLSYRVLRTLAFLPQVLSGIIVGFVWKTIFGQDGPLNQVLVGIGLVHEPVNWLGTPQMAALSVGIVMTWVMSGFTTVVYLAALQGVPVELYEASAIDGAGPWKQFRLITARMVAPATTITATVGLIMMIKVYDVIVAMTSGGPASSTESVALYIINVAFTNDQAGYASAIALLLLVISAIVSLTVTSLLRRREVDL